jgi:hypothetical protein
MNALRWFSSLLFVSLATLTLAAAPGCGGGDKVDVKSPTAEPAMDDALSLLPGSAIAVGTVDARAFFSSQTFGSDLAKLVEKYVPIGTEAGFQASRDVDRVTFASYSYQGIDVAAIVIGRFDSAKIKLVAANQTPTKNGGTLVVSQYTGRDVYTVNNIGFTLLSDTRAIVGTEQGIRRVLERINDKRVKRDIAPWMISTVETSGAAVAVAADFASTPIPPENAKQIPSPLITNLKAARLVATFKDGVNLAGSITYADAASAESSAAVVKQSMGYAKLLAVFGIKLQNVDIKTDKSDVQVSLLVDDQSLRALLANVPSLMGQ